MTLNVRLATEDDLDDVVSLTAANRKRLAEWSPTWRRPSAVADQVHPFWLQHLVQSDGPVLRVLEEDGSVIACAASMPQSGQWFIDDIAIIDDNRWPDAGTALLNAIPERPALMCVPAPDHVRAEAAHTAGLSHVSSYWIRPADTGDFRPQPIPTSLDIPEPPPHTFGGRLDPYTHGALAFIDEDGGIVVGSTSVMAPPVYDPGGTVSVIDLIDGPDRASLLRAALAGAAQRGDILVNVVAATDDTQLHRLLDEAAFQRTVDVYSWP